MTEHLTEQQIESFQKRKMSPEGLRTAHQHIAVCKGCRARLSSPGQFASALAAFEKELQAEDAQGDHLRYQQLSGYVDDELHEIDREIVESHLETCADCAAEIRDLRAFKATIAVQEHETIETHSRSERPLTWWNWPARWSPAQLAAAAIGVILILTAAFFLLRAKFFHQDQTKLAQSPQANGEATPQNLPLTPAPTASPLVLSDGELEKPSDKNRVRPPAQPEQLSVSSPGSADSSQIVVALRDGERLVTLDSRGRLSGVAARSDGVQRLLAAALRLQRLEQPPGLDRLIRGASMQLGMPDENSSFALLRPVGTVVESDRPIFGWEPLPGASSYVISVFDAQLNEVARSESLSTTVWKPSLALRRGAIYRWQVIAVKDGREVVLPSATAPEARFKVLEGERAQALQRARRRYGNSHLALGVLYAHQGLLDEAETELRALVEDNPDSTVARKLLQGLQAWRPTGRRPPGDVPAPTRPER